MSYIREAIESGKEYYESRVNRDIERNRKGDFTVTVQKNGKASKHAELSYELKNIDFDFGCNIFMLGQQIYAISVYNNRATSLCKHTS